MINTISFEKLGLDFTINRAAFSIGNFSIYWYGIIIAFGLILAILYGMNEIKKSDISSDDFFNMLIISIPSAIIGARLYYVIFSWEQYADNIMSVFDIRSGGIAIYGGIIATAIVILVYCSKKKINIGSVLDILAVGLLIGQCVGRWGNFVNGEAFGGETMLPWAMTIKNNGKIVAENVHPTFLYESLWNFIGIFALLFYKRIKNFNGEIFCAYMVWYGAGRTIIEGLRSDSLYLGFLRVSQIVSLCALIAGLILIIYNRKKLQKAAR